MKFLSSLWTMRTNFVVWINWRLQQNHFKNKTTRWTIYWGKLCKKTCKIEYIIHNIPSQNSHIWWYITSFFKTWWRHILDWLWNNIFRCIINDYWYTFFYTSWSLWTSANHLRDLTCKVLNLMIKIKNLLLTKIVISETTLSSQIVRRGQRPFRPRGYWKSKKGPRKWGLKGPSRQKYQIC